MAYGGLALFWALALWRLDRYPPVNDDEPWTLLPGFSLFTRGVFGSPAFAGYFGMDRVYFQSPPLMSLLQGASARVLGLGVWQMRFLPVVSGALTLALCFQLGRRWIAAEAGALAVALLIFWRWTPGGAEGQGSGVLLLDIARIARYDILTAPLGLAALGLFLLGGLASRRRWPSRWATDMLAGLLVGLAGLAHFYGLFWLPVFGILLLAAYGGAREWLPALLRRSAWLVIGLALVWLPWIVLILANWPLFQGQTSIYRGHFALLRPGFYLRNVLQESQRYFPGGFASASVWPLVGAWVLVLGVPSIAAWLLRRALQRKDPRTAWLWVPALLFPILFAALVEPKTHAYLISFVAVLALLLAFAWHRLLGSRRALWRAISRLGLVLLISQGALGIVHMLQNADAAAAPAPFYARLQIAISKPGLIVGPLKYWFPFSTRDYRAIDLMYLLALINSHQASAPESFTGALTFLAPRYVLIDEIIWHSLTETDLPGSAARNETFWAYLRQHSARLVEALPDNNGYLVRIYQMDQTGAVN